jgi:hypothetical protein
MDCQPTFPLLSFYVRCLSVYICFFFLPACGAKTAGSILTDGNTKQRETAQRDSDKKHAVGSWTRVVLSLSLCLYLSLSLSFLFSDLVPYVLKFFFVLLFLLDPIFPVWIYT